MSPSSRPIIIVTGANGGVGFGICERLLYQLCHSNPTDATAQAFAPPHPDSGSAPHDEQLHLLHPLQCDGLTLIMACRSTTRAEVAKSQLLHSLDARVAWLKSQPTYDGHAEKFRKNVDINVLCLDLADIGSIFQFSNVVVDKYPYISHLIFNAGLASFSRIHWPTAIWQVLTSPMNSVTAPAFYLQHTGELSVDGLGWVWQCNFFGHFILFKSLHKKLLSSPTRARVIWTSSLESSPAYYDPKDWQMTNNLHSYESTKYQIDIVATLLDTLALRDPTHTQPRHFIAQPGICSTSIGKALTTPLLDLIKVMLFYLARMCGSPHHPITPLKAAIPAVHLSLAPLLFITLFNSLPPKPSSKLNADVPPTPLAVRYGAETDRWGHERVGLTPVKEWQRYQPEAEFLLAKCNALYEQLSAVQRAKSAS
ncbi:hypothetical protein AMATHDRAFT_145345 [Amanita thiersii Skay4041]|uniref:3-keto sterol reductase n=1 Tax=Amanita thiersii Skay4041 TaxID=703135 RepID=A0A2A9NQ32_9AGAR|nr:hypothetical protein AMATHDRAFT_145345 [Amanita thiersii Skay4041]